MMRRYAISFMFFVMVFFCIGSVHAEMSDVERGSWLLGVIFKLERMRDDALSDIQTYRMEISKSEETMRKARGLMSLARKKGNTRAEMIARDALTEAQEAREKNRELLRLAQQRKEKTEFALASVRNLLARQSSMKAEIRSVVTDYTGRVSILSKRLGETIPLEGGRAGFLEPGDTIITYADSSVEMQFLDGRGTLKLGENSELTMEEDSSRQQIINMLKGKLYVGIDKLDEYLNMMEEKIRQYKSDASLVKDEIVSKFVDEYERIMERHEKVKSGRYQYMHPLGSLGVGPLLRTPTVAVAVRGTKFVVSEDKRKGTEIIVLEGTVEVRAIKKEGSVSVTSGYAVRVAKEGAISKPEKIEPLKIDRWWER